MSDVQEAQEGSMPPSERLVVHYYLRDEKHSMDAFVRNKAEAELLGMVRHVLLQLNLDVKVESSAREEGGLIDTLVLIVNNPTLLVTASVGVSAFLVSVINIIVTLMYARDKGIDKLNRQIAELSVEEKRLSIEEKKIALEKARAELLKPKPDPAVVDTVLPVLEHDTKTITLRSNYFKLLVSYQQVIAVGFGQKPKNRAAAERVVNRADFATYVIQSDKLPTVVHHDAIIQIVSPVIAKGGFHWRGVWQGESITFQMRDAAYRALVERGQEVFRSGDAIKCELNVESKVDALGNEVVTAHAVTAVTAKVPADGTVIETTKGRQLKFEKSHGPQNQAAFDFKNPEDERGK